jgi:hypothetical protein
MDSSRLLHTLENPSSKLDALTQFSAPLLILLANLFHRYKAEISAELFQASVPSKK